MSTPNQSPAAIISVPLKLLERIVRLSAYMVMPWLAIIPGPYQHAARSFLLVLTMLVLVDTSYDLLVRKWSSQNNQPEEIN